MPNPDGCPIWFELITEEVDSAKSFYGRLLGWKVAQSSMDDHHGYQIATAPDGDAVAGVMQAQGDMPRGWLVYFGANDVDALAERVGALGGKIHVPPTDIPQVGRFAYATDPQGVGFYLMRGNSPENSRAFVQNCTAQGHGSWIELATPDPEAALEFYGKLFGWSRQGGMPMGDMGEYTFLGGTDGSRPGAVMSSQTTGAPARWNWYAYVPDIDGAVAAAQEGGGQLLQGPDPIPGGDFSANVRDAQGNQLGLVGPRK